jgi:hypothetical protein
LRHRRILTGVDLMPVLPGSYEVRFGPSALLYATVNLALGIVTGGCAVYLAALLLRSEPDHLWLLVPATSAVCSA